MSPPTPILILPSFFRAAPVQGMSIGYFELETSEMASRSPLFSSRFISNGYGICSGRVIMDDFREAYHWLRENTPDDARIMSWWDYGYQVSDALLNVLYVDIS